jgi:hypothetical protein
MRLKIALLAPVARASERIDTMAKAGALRRVRRAIVRSRMELVFHEVEWGRVTQGYMGYRVYPLPDGRGSVGCVVGTIRSLKIGKDATLEVSTTDADRINADLLEFLKT